MAVAGRDSTSAFATTCTHRAPSRTTWLGVAHTWDGGCASGETTLDDPFSQWHKTRRPGEAMTRAIRHRRIPSVARLGARRTTYVGHDPEPRPRPRLLNLTYYYSPYIVVATLLVVLAGAALLMTSGGSRIMDWSGFFDDSSLRRRTCSRLSVLALYAYRCPSASRFRGGSRWSQRCRRECAADDSRL